MGYNPGEAIQQVQQTLRTRNGVLIADGDAQALANFIEGGFQRIHYEAEYLADLEEAVGVLANRLSSALPAVAGPVGNPPSLPDGVIGPLLVGLCPLWPFC